MRLWTGSEEELQSRLRNFDENIAKQKQNRRRHESERQDFEDELAKARRTHVELVNEHGELAAEAKARPPLAHCDVSPNDYYRHMTVA